MRATTLSVTFIAVAFATCLNAHASSLPGEDQFEAGMEAYQRCWYADALTSMTLAAHLGHRRAQEVAGLMNLLGASLYGSAIGTDRRAAKRWFELAAAQGSEVGAKLAGISVAGPSPESQTASR